MLTNEFSDSFDSLLNSYASQAVFGEQASRQEIVLDEYEKSVLLTQAQDIVVKSIFDRKKNSTGDGFDDNTERQMDFSTLTTVATLQQAMDQTSTFDDRGILYYMPRRVASKTRPDTFDITYDYTFHPGEDASIAPDVLFILNEKLVTVAKGIIKNYVVVPINYKEYDREMSKPYAQPLKKQAWRLFQNQTTGFDFRSELIPRWNLTTNETITGYRIRYIRRPIPIVLTDLPDGLSIDGITRKTECELNPILHPEILQKAVEIAAATRGIAKPSKE